MSREQITSDPAAPAPSAPPTIDVNKHGSARLPAAAADSDEEASTLIISAGYALLTPPQHVAVAPNAGLRENPGTVSDPDTRGLLIEVYMVPGTGRVSVVAGRQAGATASTVRLQWV